MRIARTAWRLGYLIQDFKNRMPARKNVLSAMGKPPPSHSFARDRDGQRADAEPGADYALHL